jgi:gliding motility-associated-like protein
MKTKLLSHSFYLLILVMLWLPNEAKASHVQGGNLTYQCLSGNQYRIRLALYRDCAGIAAENTQTVTIRSVSCNITQTVTLTKIAGTGQEVTPICPGQATRCTGGTQPGVQEYIYEAIVTLPPCADWVMTFNLCCRNSAITTINTPGSMNINIQATLNNLAFPCNDSPTFTNRPVPFICVGQPFCFNNGSIDSDGDSLSYTLMTPMHTNTVNVTYIAPYNANNPLASSPAATFNPLTGDMCVTPTSLQVTVFAVLVKEWRNGVLVGSVMRDVQVRTITCTNNNPSLNGINNTGSYAMNACAGTPISFNIPSFDVNTSQNVTLTWNSGIPGASFSPTGGAGGTASRPTGVFTWTPTLADVSGIPHCFTVKVTDNNCPYFGSQTYSFCITVGGFNVTPTIVPAICNSATGSISLATTAGVTPFTYSWTPAVSTGTNATNLTPGNYTCTVTDATGCTRSTVYTVPSTPGGTASISSFANVTCNAANNGTATVTTAGAFTAPLTYAWTPSGGTAATASNLAPGTYTCTVTDVNGCTATTTQVITQPAPLTVAPTFTNVGCFGGTSGTATATPAGGTAPYGYLWMPGAFTTASINNLGVGTYTVTVTDARGCTTTGTAAITQPPVLAITSSTTPANCGQATGTASVTGSGGFAPYTWSWSNSQTGPNASALAAGTYTVTITDVNMCTLTAPVTVGSNAGPTATINTSTNVSCFGGNNGNATVTITGGTAPFTYLWSNGQTTPTASNLVAGIYSVSVTDANGCIAGANITITQPTLLVANAVSTNPLCFGAATGTATASAVGGTAPYNYAWTTAGSPTTPTLTGLVAGTYSVTITDALGCIQNSSVTLTNPPTLSTSVAVTPVTCFAACNGTAVATVTNGTAPYTYAWNNPTAQTTANASGLCAGSFTVSVTDANGCPSQGVAVISQPTAFTSNIFATGNLTCFGVCTGFAQITASGGTAPYAYNWMPGGITTASATNLCAGTYTCTVTDANGCTTTSVTTITQPAELIASITGNDITCAGSCDGSGNISFIGGTAPYTFLWMPSLETVYNPADLCIGTHTATITDANGCAVSGSINIIEAYTPLIVTTTTISSNCGQFNGEACATTSGGLAPYTYFWNDLASTQLSCATSLVGGAYVVQVADANGCMMTQVANVNDIAAPDVLITSQTDLPCAGYTNGAATTSITGGAPPYSVLWTAGGQTTANPTDLVAGINIITVTDAAGCVSSNFVDIQEPNPINNAITSLTDVSCFGLCDGAATLMANGGTGTLTYAWSSGQTTPAVTALCAGTYSVVITDANGCTTTNSPIIVDQPAALAITNSSSTDISCFGDNDGSINTSASGGTPFYLFNWSPNVSTGPVANSLTAGTYTLTVQDQNGCTTSQNYTISQPTQLTDTTGVTASTCGAANGEALVTAFGGTTPYTYQWNNSTLQTTPTATNLLAGNYSVIVTDNNGCNITSPVVIIDTPGPTIDSVSSTPVLCFGGSTGTATIHLTANTGTAPFTYDWNPGTQTLPAASGLPQGVYNVTVTDDNGCSATGTVIISEAPELELFVSTTDTICYGDTAQIYAQATGGTPQYNYTWLGATGAGLTGTGPHFVTPTATSIYSVSVTDANACPVGPMDIQVVVRPPLTVSSTNIAVCDGLTGTIAATPAGGNGGPYTYSWSNGPTTQSQTVTGNAATSPASYIVTVSDGCSQDAVDTSIVTVNPGSIGSLSAPVVSGCAPLTVTFTGISDNGVSYAWDFGDSGTGTNTPVTHVYTSTGVYDVTMTITTAAGCVTTVVNPGYITVNPNPDAAFTANPNPASSISPLVNFYDGSTANIVSWNWNFGDVASTSNTSTVQNPSHVFSGVGFYPVGLLVTNQFGCIDSTYIMLEVQDDFVFYAPNAFTPDGDGINDTFYPLGVGWDLDSYELMIFDRWGQMIFFSDDKQKGWDGKANHGSEMAQIDVYVWKVKLRDTKGYMHNYIGHVTIVK